MAEEKEVHTVKSVSKVIVMDTDGNEIIPANKKGVEQKNKKKV